MNSNYRDLNRCLDLAGLVERVAKREAVRKEAQQKPQQVDVAEAALRGFDSAHIERQRETLLKRLQNDPMLAYFLLSNRGPSSA